MSIAAMTRNALLLEAEDAPQPFIRDRAGRQLESLNIPGCRIYSVDTAEQFWSCLPAISGVAVILFAAVVIWVQSLFLLKNHRENRWWLAVDVLLGVGLLWGLWRLLGQIDLPSDLLPAENILQWSHYTEEFSQIMSALSTTRGNLFDSMRHLGRTGQQTINLALRMTAQVKKIAIFGTILPLLWGILPLLVRVCFTKKNSMQH